MRLLLVWAIAAAAAGAPPPDQDFDKDGVPDISDDCPTDPGATANKGCPGEAPPPPPPPPAEPPKVKVEKGRIDLDQKVHFRSGSASVAPKSFALIQQIAAAIGELPPEAKVTIVGHTDNRGRRRTNIALSKRRAQAVVAHLVRAGVDRARLEAQGHGPDRPIASNKTAAGRRANRRVELLVGDGSASKDP